MQFQCLIFFILYYFYSTGHALREVDLEAALEVDHVNIIHEIAVDQIPEVVVNS